MTADDSLALLATDHRRADVDVSATVLSDGSRRGAVAARGDDGTVRRAEPGPAGPLLLAARRHQDGIALSVHGPRQTSSEAVEAALNAAASWAGCDDDPAPFDELAASHPATRQAWRHLGSPHLSRLPRVGEAFGRAVAAQLVQSQEAARSIAQIAMMIGRPCGQLLWCWPTAAQLGATSVWTLRRCGISSRGARTLHAASVADRRLEQAAAARDWRLIDRLVTAIPGAGPWTSAETRLALGDPDAVSVGDYHLPTLVGMALTGRDEAGRGRAWNDEDLLGLLAPFDGQRGRAVRFLLRAVGRGLLPRAARRAPRAALSAHRYW